MFVQDSYAGTITETDEGYEFAYDRQYLDREDAVAVSLTMPLTEKTYKSTVIFPFFDGLVPEGWLLDITSRNRKIDRDDRFGLLLAACRDCIGDVYIRNEMSERDAFIAAGRNANVHS